MCGRYALTSSPEKLAHVFALGATPSWKPRYNVAPGQPVAVVRLHSESPTREWALLRWGLIPSWAKDPNIGHRTINARAETAAEKPSFRSALQRKRCLVPADGFYEWRREGKAKQPFYIRLKEDRPFAFAGLWEQWESPDGRLIESCAILTTEPNEIMAPIHHRMPVLLAPTDYDRWLDPHAQAIDALRFLFRPYSSDALTAYPVNPWVNHPGHDDPRCLERLAST